MKSAEFTPGDAPGRGIFIAIEIRSASEEVLMSRGTFPLRSAKIVLFLLAVGSAAIVNAVVPVANEREAKLSGCLVRGEGDDGGYLLTNTAADPAWLNPDSPTVAPSAVGTTGGFTTVFYWLEGGGDLKQHVGHYVEVEGDVKGELKNGEIKLDRKDQWTEVTIKADGRTMKANVPNSSVLPASPQDRERKGEVLVRRIAVEHVNMRAASCTP
jgi:hypothetical protein